MAKIDAYGGFVERVELRSCLVFNYDAEQAIVVRPFPWDTDHDELPRLLSSQDGERFAAWSMERPPYFSLSPDRAYGLLVERACQTPTAVIRFGLGRR